MFLITCWRISQHGVLLMLQEVLQGCVHSTQTNIYCDHIQQKSAVKTQIHGGLPLTLTATYHSVCLPAMDANSLCHRWARLHSQPSTELIYEIISREKDIHVWFWCVATNAEYNWRIGLLSWQVPLPQASLRSWKASAQTDQDCEGSRRVSQSAFMQMEVREKLPVESEYNGLCIPALSVSRMCPL